MVEHLWVDTAAKSRLTLQDRRAYGDTNEIVHCPTPSSQCNNALEFLAVYLGHPMWCFDVVSAFPHASESAENIYMDPPKEWTGQSSSDPYVWKMEKSLYGRRSAGANFRDYLEEVVLAAPKFEMIRGDSEPCCYRSQPMQTALTHHIDDGRIVAPEASGLLIIQHLATYMLLKISDMIVPGVAVSHLGRLKIRIPGGWITIPDGKHLENVFRRVGFGEEKVPGRSVPTPGVKRDNADENDEFIKNVEDYRSATGSLIYYSLDVEVLTFCVKELARGLQAPTVGDWQDLKRCARWLWTHQDMVVVNEITCLRQAALIGVH